MIYALITTYLLGGYVSLRLTSELTKKKYGAINSVLLIMFWLPAAVIGLTVNTFVYWRKSK